MDDSISTDYLLEGFTPRYVRKLLIERVYIYAKLHNPGGSIILRGSDSVDPDKPLGYSTEIGNMFHLDLIELEQQFNQAIEEGDLTRKQVEAILTWADGMSSRDAADYLHAAGPTSIQKMRERASNRLQERLDGTGRQKSGRTSDRDSKEGRQG